MIEKIIFNVLAFVIFITIFWKLIKRNDTIYIYILVVEFIGIAIRFFSIIKDIHLNITVLFVIYMISIIIPGVIILLEKKRIFLSEFVIITHAKISLKYGNNELARKNLIKLISKYPDSYYAHKLLAEIYEKECRDEDAIDEYVRAVEINPTDYDSYYQISFLLNKNKKQNEAKEMLKDLLSKKPGYYKASELLGTILYDQEDFKQAVAVYLEALKYNPIRYELYYGLGMVYTRLNDFQTAKEYYEKAATINSMLYHARLNIAQIALITGELEEAEERFTNCLQDKDSEPDAYYYLAIIALLKGDKEKAISYINIAIELDYRFYKKICKQEIFRQILDYVREGKNKVYTYNLTYEEIKTKKHLDKTFRLIEDMKTRDKKVENEGGIVKDRDNIEGYQRE